MKQKSIDNDARFRKLIENSQSGITLFNASLEVIYRSPSAAKITGWPIDDNAATTVPNLVHADDLSIVSDTIKAVMAVPGFSQTCQFRALHAAGHYVWLESTTTNLLDDPDVKAVVSNFRDITEQKTTELKLKQQTDQISELLETMTDSFISLDANLCYTYANKQAIRLLGKTAESLIGQHVSALFPDVGGSATYQAIQTAFTEKKHVCNEDFYAPLQLWQENRVYPSAGGVSVFIRDITKQKKEEQNLKLLESVITNTTDAVLITEAEPFDEPGNRIIYVNTAFTSMTGYTAEDVIGKTTRILQGPKTDKGELRRLGEAIRRWESCEVTVVNYKKNGEEFWNNFSLSPVADETGWFTHWISIDKDVTERKNEELKKLLLADLSRLFNSNLKLIEILDNVCARLIESEDFVMASIYLVATDQRKLKLASQCVQPGYLYLSDQWEVKTFEMGEGLPGLTWGTKTMQRQDRIADQTLLSEAPVGTTLTEGFVYGVPLFDNNEVIGVLILATKTRRCAGTPTSKIFEYIGAHLGIEVARKQQEEELNQIFNFAPDVICIAGTDGYFKKVNPALCTLLEYTKTELLAKPLIAFIHPDDQERMTIDFNNLSESRAIFNFETRTVSKSGKIKWITWTSTPASEEGLLFCTAKDITEKKELESLLDKATHLARIGSWELDWVENTVYWSDMTREIHEVAPDFQPDWELAINFYAEGTDRDLLIEKISDAVENGTPCDLEVQIVTAKGYKKWIRVVGEAEFLEGKCIRVYGSFQDIDKLKKAEIKAIDTFKEKNTILESIGDAFFAVDQNWTVTYWNQMAEKVLLKTKEEMIDRNLWSVFLYAIGSESYLKYHQVLESKLPAHFEDHYLTSDKWYEISAYPSANGLSVYIKDITDRKLSDGLIKDSEKRYSNLFQLSPMAKWVFDLETLMFLDVNNAAIYTYGYTREEFLNMTIKDIRPAEQMGQLTNILGQDHAREQYIVPGIITHHKKNGELMMVEIQSSDIDYKGKKARIIIANNVTERLKYIRAIEKQNKKLKEISWMQSHVIRAPLSRIMGLIPLMDDVNTTPAELKQVTEYIRISALELDEVIHHITDKSNIDE